MRIIWLPKRFATSLSRFVRRRRWALGAFIEAAFASK
jgi:hypothetical protein